MKTCIPANKMRPQPCGLATGNRGYHGLPMTALAPLYAGILIGGSLNRFLFGVQRVEEREAYGPHEIQLPIGRVSRT